VNVREAIAVLRARRLLTEDELRRITKRFKESACVLEDREVARVRRRNWMRAYRDKQRKLRAAEAEAAE